MSATPPGLDDAFHAQGNGQSDDLDVRRIGVFLQSIHDGSCGLILDAPSAGESDGELLRGIPGEVGTDGPRVNVLLRDTPTGVRRQP